MHSLFLSPFKKKYFCNHLFLLFLGLRAVRRSIKSSFRTIVSLSCSENLSRVDHHRKVDKAELLLDGELRVTGDDSSVRVQTLIGEFSKLDSYDASNL